jgi:hypothetical protein
MALTKDQINKSDFVLVNGELTMYTQELITKGKGKGTSKTIPKVLLPKGVKDTPCEDSKVRMLASPNNLAMDSGVRESVHSLMQAIAKAYPDRIALDGSGLQIGVIWDVAYATTFDKEKPVDLSNVFGTSSESQSDDEDDAGFDED